MKNVNYIINGILAVAVVILFVMQLSEKRKQARQTQLSPAMEMLLYERFRLLISMLIHYWRTTITLKI